MNIQNPGKYHPNYRIDSVFVLTYYYFEQYPNFSTVSYDCVVDTENEYGRFLKFKDLTVCPIDLDAIDPKYMTDAEVTWLNEYHKEVYETLKDRLSEEEAEWLKEATRAISK